MSSHKFRGERDGKELLVTKLVIANISNKATGMLLKSEPLETYPSYDFRWNRVEPVGMKPGGTCWDETGCSADVWNPFQTQVKPVLVCSVDRPKSNISIN